MLKSLIKDIVARTNRPRGGRRHTCRHPSGSMRTLATRPDLRHVRADASLGTGQLRLLIGIAARRRTRSSTSATPTISYFSAEKHREASSTRARCWRTSRHGRCSTISSCSGCWGICTCAFRSILPRIAPRSRSRKAGGSKTRTTPVAFGPLAIFAVPGVDGTMRVKGWKENVAWTFLYRQYYFERNGVEVKPVSNDHVIDAGGCFGDTALGFADTVGSGGHVYVFDPLPKHCAIMRQQLELLRLRWQPNCPPVQRHRVRRPRPPLPLGRSRRPDIRRRRSDLPPDRRRHPLAPHRQPRHRVRPSHLRLGTDTTTVANHRTFDAYGRRTSETNSAIDHLFGTSPAACSTKPPRSKTTSTAGTIPVSAVG